MSGTSEKSRPLFPPREEEEPLQLGPPIGVPSEPPPPPPPPPPTFGSLPASQITAGQIERAVVEVFAKRLGPLQMPYGLGRLVAACEGEVVAELVRLFKAPA